MSLKQLDIANTGVCGAVPEGLPAVNQSGAVSQLAPCPSNQLSAGAIAGIVVGAVAALAVVVGMFALWRHQLRKVSPCCDWICLTLHE